MKKSLEPRWDGAKADVSCDLISVRLDFLEACQLFVILPLRQSPGQAVERNLILSVVLAKHVRHVASNVNGAVQVRRTREFVAKNRFQAVIPATHDGQVRPIIQGQGRLQSHHHLAPALSTFVASVAESQYQRAAIGVQSDRYKKASSMHMGAAARIQHDQRPHVGPRAP